MRKIELKTVDKFDYKQMLKLIVSSPTRGGSGSLNLDEVRRAVKILDLLEAANGVLLLEETDWAFVKDRVTNASYTVADRRIVDFADAVLLAATVSVTEAT